MMSLLSHFCIALTPPSSSLSASPLTSLQFSTKTLNFLGLNFLHSDNTRLRIRHYNNPSSSMTPSCSCSSSWTLFDETGKRSKKVWIWTNNKQVMTAAVERGWNTFVFSSHHRQLAHDWSCQSPLFGSKFYYSFHLWLFSF